MSFDIDAHIENGQPALRILDADTHSVRLAWRCPSCDEACTGPDALALKQLFRELFLLSLLEKLKKPSPLPSPPCGHSLRSGRGSY